MTYDLLMTFAQSTVSTDRWVLVFYTVFQKTCDHIFDDKLK